jgi:DNA (cytosine-5)-methyltransferase 1
VYGRMAWDEVAPTITGGCVNPSKGRFLHPAEHRTITLREAALLQTFPADHKFSLRRGKFAAAEMIGNALPPLLVKVQATAVAQHICGVTSRKSLTAGRNVSTGGMHVKDGRQNDIVG